LPDVTAGGGPAGTAADTAADSVGQDAPEGAPSVPAAAAAGAGLGRARRARSGARALLAGHWQFGVVLTVAAALRCVVMLGYPPILWYSDSYNYVADAVSRIPDVVRSSGYPLFLLVLLPLHSLTLIAALQALMGLGMGAIIYAVLRHRGLPWWGATLPALPVLFDVYEMQLEHMVMSDVLFIFLITVALALLCWSDRPPVAVCAVAGLMIGYAALVRTVGEPLLVVVVVALLLRRVSWKRVAPLLVAGIAPIAGYMIWYHGFYGQYALDGSSGTFLYSRVSSFAECSKMHLPARLTVLCDPRPPSQRPSSQEYLWSTSTPLFTASNHNQFSKHANSVAGEFAKDAILSQPLAYANVVLRDTAREFTWTRTQSNLTGSGPSFQFQSAVTPLTKNNTLWWVLYYRQDRDGLLRYTGPGMGQPTAVKPFSGFLVGYEKVFYLRGTLLGVILLLGAGGVIARWRRWGGVTLLPWAVAMVLVVLPPMTAGFSYRYVIAATPAACLAAGLALTREPRTSRKAARAALASASASASAGPGPAVPETAADRAGAGPPAADVAASDEAGTGAARTDAALGGEPAQ
jgi:Glycosyltransferase family 87